ncbi:MAG: hypothetical protein FWE77_01895 [Clostridia bacterium]|nr:hypothetical protein [Clostridia bacterium]
MTDDLFRSHISQEIHPPMNAIAAMVNQLLAMELDAVQLECVKGISGASGSLQRIVGDMMDMHAPTAETPLREQPYCFCTLIGTLLDAATSLARGKGLACVVSLAPDIPAELIGDGLRLKRTLLGLVDSALQHVGSGHVKFEVTAKCESAQRVLLHFRIEDGDIGLHSSFRIRQRCATDAIIAPLPRPEAYRVLLLSHGVRGSACRDMFASLGVAVAHCTAPERACALLAGDFTHVFFDYDAFHPVLVEHAPAATRRVAILSAAGGTEPDPSLFDAFVFEPPLISEVARHLRGQ